MRNLSIILTLLLLISCNSKTSKESNNESKTESQIEEQNAIKPLEKKSEKIELKDPILFAEVNWFKPNKESVSVFKGINSLLMEQIITDYVQAYHIDPNRRLPELKDSISLDFINRTFKYFCKIAEYNTYDEFGEGRERVTEELNNPYGEYNQSNIHLLIEELKKEKVYDYYVVSGSFDFLYATSDSLRLKITGELGTMYAGYVHTYSEERVFTDENYDDEISFDMMLAINNLGGIKKFTKNDLEIVNKEGFSYIRNQFYARKGRKFNTKKMKKYFEPKEWYKPLYDDVTDQLSETEMYNIYFIKDIEEGKK